MDNLTKIIEDKFDFSPWCQKAVQHLKEIIVGTPMKLYYNEKKERAALKLEFEFPMAEYVLLPPEITELVFRNYSIKKEKSSNDCYKITLVNE